MPAEVRFASADGVAAVTITHGGRFNAMSRAMWLQLRTGFEQLAGDASMRCVLVQGASGHFCAGGDISEYADFRFDPQLLRDFHEDTVWGALQAMIDCELPVVAAIEGNCMGAGLEIASCCDIRIAGRSARFGAPIAKLGFPMAPRELDLVLRELGPGGARQLLLEASTLDAPRMLELGFLSQLADDAEVSELAQASVRRIAALAPQAARMNKRNIRALMTARAASGDTGHGAGSRAVLDRLAETAYGYADSAEHREGVQAFLDKRRPRF